MHPIRLATRPVMLATALVAWIVLALGVAGPSPAAAQFPLAPGAAAEGGAAEASALDTVIEQARRDGSTVIVVQPGATAGETPVEMPMAETFSSAKLLEARANLVRMFGHTILFLEDLLSYLRHASPDGKAWWLLIAFATSIGGLVAGSFVYRLTTRWGRDHFRSLYKPDEATRSGKLAYILARAGWMLLSSGIMFVTAILFAVVFDSGHEPTRETIYVIVSTYIAYRVLRSVIFWNFFAPGAPSHRLINLSDAAAQRMFGHWAIVLAIGAVIIGLSRWIRILGFGEDIGNPALAAIADDAHNFAFIAGMFVCAAMMAALAINHRRELTAIILGKGDPAEKPVWLRAVAFAALPLVLAYLVLAWLATSVRLTLGLPGGYLLVGAPILVFVVAIFAYGLAAFLLELFYERREAVYNRRQVLKLDAERRAWDRTQRSREIIAEMNEDTRELLEDGDEMAMMSVPMQPLRTIRPYFPAFKEFFQHVIQATILVVSFGELGRLWGLDLGREGGHPYARVLDVVLVVIIAGSAYRTVNRYIDHKILEEGGTLDDQPFNPGDGDNESGKSQSRLATLLPIFRNVIVSVLVVVGAMVVLANLGVDIAPLFAGAGVVGIAIGFGAQTLIRDIFSGAFFLVDDAFRKGEYIEIDKVKGVVEKISMRSFQLRHHLGAVHTVPFGEIKQLTNYSRDWVMMKLPLRLTYDTDIEKVRKLIKKLGQKLLEDPVVGPLFLQPLKSQGVYSMEDSAMILRVKFMTRPGNQFVTRKVVYAAIRDIFQREGIRFAHREVTVRLADGQKVDSLTPEQKEAIAGSVRSLVEDQAAGGPDPSRAAAAAM